MVNVSLSPEKQLSFPVVLAVTEILSSPPSPGCSEASGVGETVGTTVAVAVGEGAAVGDAEAVGEALGEAEALAEAEASGAAEDSAGAEDSAEAEGSSASEACGCLVSSVLGVCVAAAVADAFGVGSPMRMTSSPEESDAAAGDALAGDALAGDALAGGVAAAGDVASAKPAPAHVSINAAHNIKERIFLPTLDRVLRPPFAFNAVFDGLDARRGGCKAAWGQSAKDKPRGSIPYSWKNLKGCVKILSNYYKFFS